MYRALDPLAPGYVLRRRTGDLVSAVTSDVETVEYFFAHTIAPAFVAVLVPGGVLVALAFMGWPLALVLLPFLIAVGLSPVLGQRASIGAATEARGLLGLVHAHIVDSVQGLRTIVAFTYGPGRLAEIAANGRDLERRPAAVPAPPGDPERRHRGADGARRPGRAGRRRPAGDQGQLAPTLLPLATLLSLSSFGPVTDIAKVAKQLAETLAASRRVFAVHDEPVTVLDGPRASLPESDRARAGRRLRERHLRATARTSRPRWSTSRSRSSRARPWRWSAAPAPGKTTAAHLLLRFWDPTAGRITLGGVDLRELQLDELRQQVGLVAQDTYLFNASLGENLRLARPDATDADLDRATALANADGSSSSCRTATRPGSASAAPTSRAASASGSRSPARC